MSSAGISPSPRRSSDSGRGSIRFRRMRGSWRRSMPKETTYSSYFRGEAGILRKSSTGCGRGGSIVRGSHRKFRSWSRFSAVSFSLSSWETCCSGCWAESTSRAERNPDISPVLSLSQQWFDGHSGGDTPGPIPNPEVKPAHVPCGSAVREPARSLPSFEEGLGRRPRYASRPSLWWTTKRAVLTAVGPWNAVSHSLFLFVAFRAEFQSDDDQGDREHENHVGELRNRDRRGRAVPSQRVPARGRVVQERPVHELRPAEARVHARGHRERVRARGHTGEVPIERATVRPSRRGARSDIVEAVRKRVLDRHGRRANGARVVVVQREGDEIARLRVRRACGLHNRNHRTRHCGVRPAHAPRKGTTELVHVVQGNRVLEELPVRRRRRHLRGQGE